MLWNGENQGVSIFKGGRQHWMTLTVHTCHWSWSGCITNVPPTAVKHLTSQTIHDKLYTLLTVLVFLSLFCLFSVQLVEQHASGWQVPLPQLRILEKALRYFARASTFFTSNCDHVLHTLSSLSLWVHRPSSKDLTQILHTALKGYSLFEIYLSCSSLMLALQIHCVDNGIVTLLPGQQHIQDPLRFPLKRKCLFVLCSGSWFVQFCLTRNLTDVKLWMNETL